MLDQSPHQLARPRASRPRPRARDCSATPRRCRSPTTSFDRYVSAGSIEYWPTPSARSPRPTASCGRRRALVDRPGAARQPLARRSPSAWMLFPTEQQYRDWMQRAGFADVERSRSPRTGTAAARPVRRRRQRRQARAGPVAAALPPPAERRDAAERRRPLRALRRRLARGRGVRADRRGARAARTGCGAAALMAGPAALEVGRGPPLAAAARPRSCGASAPAHVIGRAVSIARPVRDRCRRARRRRRRDDGLFDLAGPGRRPVVNVFIVGINQLEDVEIDRINKPFLPIAAGDLTVRGRGGSSPRRASCRSCWRSRRARSRRRGGRRAGDRRRLLVPAAAAQALPPPRRCRSPSCARWSSTSASCCTSPRRSAATASRSRRCGR